MLFNTINKQIIEIKTIVVVVWFKYNKIATCDIDIIKNFHDNNYHHVDITFKSVNILKQILANNNKIKIYHNKYKH